MGEEIVLSAGGNLLSSVGSAILGNSLGRANEEKMWNERYSPQAQVRNLAAAGINPAVAMGNQSPVLTSGGQLTPVPVDSFGIGTTALSEIGNYFKSLADAKKAGAEEKNVSVQTDKALTEIEAQKMQNEFTKKYGNQKWLLDLSNAYQNVLLSQKSNDIKEQEKAINEWKKVSEKAISEANEYQRDMLKKDLDNKDEEIRLSNNLIKEKAKTEKSSQSSNYASANASNAAASASRAQARIFDIEKDIKALERKFRESTNVQEIETKLSELRKESVINDTEYEEGKKRLDSISKFNKARENSKVVENGYLFFDWLGDIISKPFKNIIPKK